MQMTYPLCAVVGVSNFFRGGQLGAGRTNQAPLLPLTTDHAQDTERGGCWQPLVSRVLEHGAFACSLGCVCVNVLCVGVGVDMLSVSGFGLVFGGFEAAQAGMWREPKLMAQYVFSKSMTNALRYARAPRSPPPPPLFTADIMSRVSARDMHRALTPTPTHVRAQTRSFGGFLGAYSGIKCSLVVARGGKMDVLNAGVAGAIAGSIGTLRTRNPAMIAGSAAVTGCIMMVVEGVQGSGL